MTHRSVVKTLRVPLLLLGLMVGAGAAVVDPSAPAGEESADTNARSLSFAFWNLENLFDTEDDPRNPGDDEYLPEKEWTPERYERKVDHLARMIAKLDVDLLGVCEVENRRVLEDLVRHPALAEHGYAIAHLDAGDKRGIDLGLLHRAPFSIAEQERAIHVWKVDLGKDDNGKEVPPTRGILEVRLVAEDEPLTVLVNHWPSRSGGREKSAPHRQAAAETVRRIVTARLDAARDQGREGDILLLGDFNDDPHDPSLVEHLGAVRGKQALEGDRGRTRLFNPSWSVLATPDRGTLYYRAGWNVFDQAIVSRGMLDEVGFSFVEGSFEVVDRAELRNDSHVHRPPHWFRRYGGGWSEGYSDHFAVRGSLRLHPPSGE